MIKIKNEEIFEEVDEIKSIEAFESDNNQTFFKGSGENLKNYRIYGENGKNLLNDKELKIGGLNAINGEEIVDTTTIRSPFIKGFSNYRYYLTLFNDEYKIENIYYYNYNYLFLGKIEVNSNYTNFTPISSTLFIRITFKKKDETQNISTLDLENKVMLSKGKAALPYETYGESVGDLVTSGEHAGEYKVPVTVEGKNLLQNTATSQTINGVTFTVNSDGSITCNGTATAITTFAINIGEIPNGIYIVSGCPKNGAYNTYRLDIRTSGNTTLEYNSEYVVDTGNGHLFDSTDAHRAVIRINTGYTCDDLTFYPMIRKADIEDDTYEPYHVPVTTPIYLDAPLCKVNGEEEYIDFLTQKVHRIQKNLLPNNTQLPTTINGVKWSIRKSDGAIMAERVSPSESPSDLVYTSSFVAPANQIFVLKLFYEGEEPSATTYSANVIYNNIDHWNRNGMYRFETDTEMSVVLRVSPEYNGIAIFAPMISNYNYNDFFDYTPYIQNTEQSIILPAISTFSDTNILSVNTKIKPSKIWGRISEPRDILYVKDNLGNVLFSKYREIEDEPPLTYKAKKAGFLTDYRIYGQTVDGESVGDLVTSGEHAGEYKVPVTVSNGTDTLTTPIYLPKPLKMVGDEAEYIDYGEQKQHRVRKNLLQNTAMSRTMNGVTFTVNSDGSVTCNGTARDTARINVSAEPSIFNDVILTGCPVGGDWLTFQLDILSSYNIIYRDVGSGVRVDTGNEEVYCRIRIASGYTCNNLTFYPMIRKADIEDDTYEPYIENTDLDVTLPALPTVTGTNVLSVGTEVQPSDVYIKGKIKSLN